jgi:hypothetical protein
MVYGLHPGRTPALPPGPVPGAARDRPAPSYAERDSKRDGSERSDSERDDHPGPSATHRPELGTVTESDGPHRLRRFPESEGAFKGADTVRQRLGVGSTGSGSALRARSLPVHFPPGGRRVDPSRSPRSRVAGPVHCTVTVTEALGAAQVPHRRCGTQA